jgi:DnaK suppressor protein
MKTQAKLQNKAPTAKAAKKKVSKPVEKKMNTPSAPIKRAASMGPMGFPPYKEQKGEEYMCKRQLDYFRDILNAWSEQLAAERNVTVMHMQEDPNNLPDLLDRAALEEEHKREWQDQERAHKLTIKIEKALARIKQGEYGYCEKCGAEIGLLRLQVRPTATLCIDCKAIDEIREKQTGIVE